MKKGLIFTLLTVTFAIAQVSTSYATAPVISQPGDVTIGDLEDGSDANVFVYPDVFSLLDLFKSDDTETAETTRWSYFSDDVAKGTGDGTGDISINGADSLDGSGTGANDPADPAGGARIDLTDADSYASDGDPYTVTFRDTVASPDDGSTTYSEPAEDIVERTVTLYAGDGSSSTNKSFLVVTANNTSDSLSGGVAGELVLDEDYASDGALGWTSGLPFSIGGTVGLDLGGLSGLCMQTGTTAQGWANWFAPDEQIDMVGNAVWRARASMTTDQTATNAIPFVSMAWDNFDTTAGFISVGGEDFFVDVAGGALGISRAQGIDTLEVWFGPSATTTAGWNTALGDPANDDFTGLRLVVNNNDTNGALGSDVDSGTICMAGLQVHRFDATEFETTTVWSPSLDGTEHDFDQLFSSTSAVADSSITGGVATIDLTAPAAGGLDGMFMRPNVASVTPDTVGALGLGNPLKFDPVIWVADTVYAIELDMRSGGSGTDPVTIITMVTTPETFEHISTNFLSRAAVGGPLDRAATPGTGLDTWRAFYASHNVSLATATELPNADRFHPTLQIFNQGALFADLGDDPLIIEGWRVSTVDNITE